MLADVMYTAKSPCYWRQAIVFCTQMVYTFMPVRTDPGTWLQCFVGLSILNILQDAQILIVHYMCHQPFLYRTFNKKHHTWKQPTAFATYYIMSWTHVVQEHILIVPVMLVFPIPLSSFIIYQYVGVPAAMMQHSGFYLYS